MPAIKKCSLILICLAVASACLVGVFTIVDSSSVRANQNEVFQPATISPNALIISPTELQATQYPDSKTSQTLWITNTGDSPLIYTIFEMSATLGQVDYHLQPVAKPVVEPTAQTQAITEGDAPVIIFLREQPDLMPAFSISNQAARKHYVYNQLVETASHSQALFEWLENQGTQPQRLLMANAITARVNSFQLKTLAMNPQVMKITLNHQIYRITDWTRNLPNPQNPPHPLHQPTTVEWNIAKIRANEAWQTFGIRGEGAVVGIVDTGVMYDHPALVNSYRGNLGGGNFDHNYNWFDFVDGQPVPYDPVGHGTMGTGIVSGDDGGNNQIGVAPAADWIAVRACGFGCTDVDLLAALEWMLAPYDLNGLNPQPSKAPDVVLGMWGGSGCDDFFQPSMAVLRAAGILPVFSPGGSGPACSTIGSPADLPETLAAGATDVNDQIASFSSRGPVLCRPGLIKPDLSAPGINIRSSYIDPEYYTGSGTSWSTAHAAGAAALVISADQNLGPDAIQATFGDTAHCIDSSQCGGGPCPEPNYVYGYGRIDAFEAVSATLRAVPPDHLPWLNEAPISGTLEAGEGVAVAVTFDSTGLSEGTYTGALGIFSSDPITPFLSVPVMLNVITQPSGPIINIDPLSFSVSLPVSGRQTETLTIANDGDSVLTFTLYEVTASQRLLSIPQRFSLPISDLVLSAEPAQVDAAVHNQLTFMGQTRLILYLRGQPDFTEAYSIADRVERIEHVYDRLLVMASQSDVLFEWLTSQGAEPHRLLTTNAIAATLNEKLLATALSFPQVKRVSINGYANILQDGPEPMNWLLSANSLPNTIEWNIAKIRADEAWNTFGIRGQGAVVGIIDTGVMYDHPALVNSYLGNIHDGNFDHNYNWFDLVNSQPVPYDDNGHGTFGAGIVTGDDGGDNQIGVAPGAQWIATKSCGNMGCTNEDLHAGMEWMLAPTDLSGSNPEPKMSPQVVLNMWGYPGCDGEFNSDLESLRAANILPVFAVGGYGAGCNTIAYPAANPNALSAGSTDITDVIGPFSARGPSCDDGGIKPDLAAPGVNIRSSTLDGEYAVWSGTSYSAAHLAGAAAMLFSADSRIGIDELEQTLFDTAVCHDDNLTCGGELCPGANNTYGHGRIDVFEAVSLTMGTNPPYDVPWLVAGPLAVEMPPRSTTYISVIFDASNLLPGYYVAGIAIESNDPSAPFTLLPVSLTVTETCQPLSDVSAGFIPPEPLVGEVVTFTASASGTLPISYTWDFGNGSIIIGPLATHIFESPGVHIVKLAVENPCDLVEMEIQIQVEAVIRRFLLPIITR